MDVLTAGKPESGEKYGEAGSHRRFRHHRRRRRRRTVEWTEVGRFARRKRERNKSAE